MSHTASSPFLGSQGDIEISEEGEWGRHSGPIQIRRTTEEDGTEWVVLNSPQRRGAHEAETKYKIEDVTGWALRIVAELQAADMPLIFARLRTAEELCRPKPSKETLDSLEALALEGTGGDNSRPASSIPNGRRGGHNPRAKLTDDQAREIYHRRLVKKESVKALAKEYGVASGRVSDIANGRAFQHIHENWGVQA